MTEYPLTFFAEGKKRIIFLGKFRICAPDDSWKDEFPDLIGFIDIARRGRSRNTIILIHKDEIDDLLYGLKLLKEDAD